MRSLPSMTVRSGWRSRTITTLSLRISRPQRWRRNSANCSDPPTPNCGTIWHTPYWHAGFIARTYCRLRICRRWRTSGALISNTESVLRRSFSALCLSSIAEREAKAPFLGEARYHQLLADAVGYLQSERDLRGYDAKLGWIHANAHTSDLLRALASSPLLTKGEQSSILSILAARLSSAPQVYTQGEQDRMAAAVLAVIRRSDFDTASFESWLTRLEDEDKQVWANPLTPETLARYQNHTYFLQALSVRLSLEPEAARIADFRQRVLGTLRTR